LKNIIPNSLATLPPIGGYSPLLSYMGGLYICYKEIVSHPLLSSFVSLDLHCHCRSLFLSFFLPQRRRIFSYLPDKLGRFSSLAFWKKTEFLPYIITRLQMVKFLSFQNNLELFSSWRRLFHKSLALKRYFSSLAFFNTVPWYYISLVLIILATFT
jgi:hypothetical protein